MVLATAARVAWLLMVALLLGVCCSGVEVAGETQLAEPGAIAGKAGLSEREVYDQALHMLRSVTLAHHRAAMTAAEARGGERRTTSTKEAGGGAPRFWSNPLGPIVRLYAKLFEYSTAINDALRFSQPALQRFRSVLHSIVGRRPTAIASGRRDRDGEQPYVTSGIDSQLESKWPSAQPKALWPAWERFSNEALFGPFVGAKAGPEHSSYTDRLLLKLRGGGGNGERAVSTIEQRVKKRVQDAVSLLEGIAQIDQQPTAREMIDAAHSQRKPSVRDDALWVLGEHYLWGSHGAQADPARAKVAFERLSQTSGNSSANVRLAFLLSGSLPIYNLQNQTDALADGLMHLTAAAIAGDSDGQISLGYRHWAGIGTPASCADALDWYELAANQGEHGLRLVVEVLLT